MLRFSTVLEVSALHPIHNSTFSPVLRLHMFLTQEADEIAAGAVSPDHCVARYLEKQQRNINEELNGISDFMVHGPSGSRTSITVVERCAAAVRHIARQMYEYCKAAGPQSSPQQTGQQLSEILIELVSRVVSDFNHDLRIQTDRARTQDARHNLYLYLIGNPLPENARGHFFVLDILQDLPRDFYRCWRHELVDIRQEIGREMGTSDVGSQRFVIRLDEILAAL